MVAGQLHTPAVQGTLYIVFDNLVKLNNVCTYMYMLCIIMYTVVTHKHVHVHVHVDVYTSVHVSLDVCETTADSLVYYMKHTYVHVHVHMYTCTCTFDHNIFPSMYMYILTLYINTHYMYSTRTRRSPAVQGDLDWSCKDEASIT